MPSDAPLRYRIIFRGECGNVLQGILSDATIESQRGWTRVIATVGDEAGFYELLDRFQDLALQPVSLTEIDGGPDDLTGSAVTPRGDPAPGTG